jgi:hypothetical protein
MDIPDEDRPGVEAMKDEALKEGIKKIREFGLAIGYFNPDGTAQIRDDGFLKKLNTFLKENGV